MKISTTICIVLFTLSTLTSCALTSEKSPKELDGMFLKENAKIDLAYVRPNVDWKKYSSIYIRTLVVTDEAKDTTPANPPRGSGHMRDSWIIPEKDIQLMKTEFTLRMVNALKDSGMKVVNEVQPDTLILVPKILDIYLNAPIEKSRDNYNQRGGTYTEGAGSMTLSATFADGETMQVIAYAVDNKYPSSMWSKNTRVQNIGDMKRLFNSWGTSLGKALKKIKE